MYSGTPPFGTAELKDPYYKLLCSPSFEKFWTAHARGKPLGFYSLDFKDLMMKMLAFDPN